MESKKVKIEKESFEKFKKIKQKNKFIIFFIVLMIVLILVLGVVFKFVFGNVFTSNQVGNTIGNIRNYGYAAKSGNWLYFLSPNEDSTQVGIFKMKDGDKEQTTKTQLVMDEWDILSLNVSKNYVYFIGILPEAFSKEDNIDNKIYRMKTDGSELEIINDNEFDNDCYEIYVVNDSIYYIGTDYNIYKMSLDGKNRELVLDNQTGYLGITDKYILYNLDNEDDTDYVTYIADLDGQNARPVIENTRLYSVNVVGDYIYYTNESKHICKVKVDGTEQATLHEVTAYNMNVSGENIYYLNYADEANANYTVCIFRVNADGSTETPENIKQLDTYSSFIDIMGEWIIYMDSNETEGFINLLKTDGQEEIKVYSLNFEEYYNTEETSEVPDEGTSEDEVTETDVSEGAVSEEDAPVATP